MQKSRRFGNHAGWKSMKSNLIAIILSAAFFIMVGSDYGFTVEPATKPLSIQNAILSYTVQSGDSLFRIAQTYNTTIANLKKANNLKGTILHAGQQLHIPVHPGSKVEAAPTPLDQVLGSGDDLKNHPLRLQLAKAGVGMLGIQYRRGGSQESGFDCSGLVKNLFSRFEIELPRSSRQQYGQGEKVDREKLETGDLVFFSSGGKQPNHVGIYIGENKFLHAALKAEKVIISDLNKTWYAVRFLGGRRISDLWEDESPPDLQEMEHHTCSIKRADKPILSQTLLFAPQFFKQINGIDLSFDRLGILDQVYGK